MELVESAKWKEATKARDRKHQEVSTLESELRGVRKSGEATQMELLRSKRGIQAHAARIKSLENDKGSLIVDGNMLRAQQAKTQEQLQSEMLMKSEALEAQKDTLNRLQQMEAHHALEASASRSKLLEEERLRQGAEEQVSLVREECSAKDTVITSLQVHCQLSTMLDQ